MIKLLKSFYTHLLGFVYPTVCVACEKQITSTESAICVDCLWNLPRHNPEINPLENKFWGKIEVKHVDAYLKFNKRGMVQNILHALKYKNNPELGRFLGRTYGLELLKNEKITAIDLIIPIPLHQKRQKQRGYNQSEMFAEGLSEAMNIPMGNNILKRGKNTTTQTKTGGRFLRYKNLEDAFLLSIDNKEIIGKNILLVDDVLTTGATLENAGKVLLDAGINGLFIATIAAA